MHGEGPLYMYMSVRACVLFMCMAVKCARVCLVCMNIHGNGCVHMCSWECTVEACMFSCREGMPMYISKYVFVRIWLHAKVCVCVNVLSVHVKFPM